MPADRGEHVETAVRQHLQQAATREARGQVGRLGALHADDLGEHVDAHRRGELGHPAEAALLVVVEQLVRRVHGLGERRRRRHVGEPHERDLDGHLLDQEGQPAGGTQEAADDRLLLDEVDRVAARGLHPAGEEVDGRPGQRLVGRGDRQRAHPHHALARLSRHGPRGQGEPGARGGLHELLEGRPEPLGVDVHAVHHQQRAGAVESPAQGPAGRVAGGGVGPQPVQARGEHRVRAGQAVRVDPGRLRRPGREVPHQQGLAAARRSDDAHPPRALQGVVQLGVDALATQAGSQHLGKVSRRAPRAPPDTRPWDLGRTTDDARPGRAGGWCCPRHRADRGTARRRGLPRPAPCRRP